MHGTGFYTVCIAFALGVAYVSLHPFSLWFAGLIAFVALALLFAYVVARRPAYLLALLALTALALGGVRTALAPKELPASLVPFLDTRVMLEGSVIAPPDGRENGNRLTVEIGKEGTKTRVIAIVPPHDKYRVGDRISVSGTLTLPESFEASGGRTFKYDRFLAKDGVFALIEPAQVKPLGRDRRVSLMILRTLQSVRDGFTHGLERAIPEPESALASGLITGGKQGLGKSLLTDFTNAGLVHIVVLSGSNVMIVAEAVLRAFGFLPRKIASFLAALVIGLFVLAAGAGSAALRAGIMALLGLFARATGRTYVVLRALFATLLFMLLWNPLLLVYDPGFEFSFVATLGLILLSSPIEHALRWMRFAFVRDIAASTLAAQISVLPILLFQTGNLSLIAFVVNLLVLPAIPTAMALASVAGFFGFAAPSFAEVLVVVVGLPAYAVLSYVIGMAHYAANLPVAYLMLPAFPFWLVAVAYASLGLLLWRLRLLESTRAPVRALPQPR